MNGIKVKNKEFGVIVMRKYGTVSEHRVESFV